MSPYVAVIDAFNRAAISYVVVGGFATVLHGYLRTTAAIDVVISLDTENARRAIDALTTLGFVPRSPVNAQDFSDERIRQSWATQKHMTVFTLVKQDNQLFMVDLFVNYPLDYQQLISRAKTLTLGGVAVRTCAIEDLIAMKSAVGRPRDLEDVKHLTWIRDGKES